LEHLRKILYICIYWWEQHLIIEKISFKNISTEAMPRTWPF